jgi:hypothetical protein
MFLTSSFTSFGFFGVSHESADIIGVVFSCLRSAATAITAPAIPEAVSGISLLEVDDPGVVFVGSFFGRSFNKKSLLEGLLEGSAGKVQ